MFTNLYQALTIVIIIVVFFIQDSIFMRRYDRDRKGGGSGRGWIYIAFILAGCVVVILQTIFLPGLGFSTRLAWGIGIQILGILLAGIALALHIWARTHLRQFYTEYIEVQPGHYVVETGPYATVRHPIIMSFFGITIGMFLIDLSLTTLLLVAYTIWDFTRSARKEEKLLAEALPEYTAYMGRTPRFLPRVSGK